LTTKPRQPKASTTADTSGLRVFDVPTDEVIENPRNPRRITEEHVDRMAALLREFKLRAPILVSTSTAPYHLEDGHLRLRAAKKLGLPTIPAVDCSDLSATQMKALRIAMNKTAEWVPWDDELLHIEIEELKLSGLDLSLTGFAPVEIELLMGGVAPALDQVEGQAGDHDEREFWPTIKVQVPKDVADRFKEAMTAATGKGDDEWVAFERVIHAVDYDRLAEMVRAGNHVSTP
jgi:ParB-like chromosome segregation protein Spo0J